MLRNTHASANNKLSRLKMKKSVKLYVKNPSDITLNKSVS